MEDVRVGFCNKHRVHGTNSKGWVMWSEQRTAGWQPRASLSGIFRLFGQNNALSLHVSHHYLIDHQASSWLLDVSPLLSCPLLSVLTLSQHTDLWEAVVRKLCVLSFPLEEITLNAKHEENPQALSVGF